MKRTVVITGARAPVAIDLARSFDAGGYEAHLADSAPALAARWSDVGLGRFHRLPPARKNFRAYADALEALIEQVRPNLIIPTCEEVFYLAAAAADRGFAEIVFTPPLETLRVLHSKIQFPQLVRGIGLPVPDTWRVQSQSDISRLPLEPDQLVLKPEFSRFGTATVIRPDERKLRGLSFKNGIAWAAQRFVEGEEICLWSAAIEGRIVAHAVYRPKWRQGRSASYLFERIEDDLAVALAERVAAATRMTGQLSFDLIRTNDGNVVPIECNPRSISGIHLFDGNADLALALTGEGPAVSAQSDIRYLAPAMLLLGMPAVIAGAKRRAFFRDWKLGRDSLGRKGDRLPWLGALLDASVFALVGLTRLNSAAGQSTDDIEWNGEPIA